MATTYPLLGQDVPRTGYGMGQLSRAVAAGGSRDDAVALLRAAYDLGVRLFDTAHFYGDGLADDLLAEAFADRRDDVLYASKAGALSTPGGAAPMRAAQHPADLRAAVEADLAALRTDHLDIVYLRRMDAAPGLVAPADQQVPLTDQLDALMALRDEGKVTGIGLSHVSLDQVREAVPAGLCAVQNVYSLLTRDDEPVLDLTRELGAAWIPYFPLGGGGHYAGLPKVTDDPVVRQVAGELGVTAQQVGLAWQLAHSPSTFVINGTSSRDHLAENIAAASVTLDDATMARLEAPRA